jgi:AcrR family transcriptional regulator
MTPQNPRGRRKNSRANGVATKKRILKAATSMFAAGGYEATSLRQISSAAQVDLATLKYHFGDKPSLFAEVYRHGHQELLRCIEPILANMHHIETEDQVQAQLGHLVVVIHDFLEENRAFIRMVLYRILEDSTDITGLEQELQGVAIDLIGQAFQGLMDKGLMRQVDSRALVVMLVSSVPMWFVTGRVRGPWVGEPALDSDAGRQRSEAFWRDLLLRLLVP